MGPRLAKAASSAVMREASLERNARVYTRIYWTQSMDQKHSASNLKLRLIHTLDYQTKLVPYKSETKLQERASCHCPLTLCSQYSQSILLYKSAGHCHNILSCCLRAFSGDEIKVIESQQIK